MKCIVAWASISKNLSSIRIPTGDGCHQCSSVCGSNWGIVYDLCTELSGMSYLDYECQQMPLDAWNYFFFLYKMKLQSQNRHQQNPSSCRILTGCYKNLVLISYCFINIYQVHRFRISDTRAMLYCTDKNKHTVLKNMQKPKKLEE